MKHSLHKKRDNKITKSNNKLPDLITWGGGGQIWKEGGLGPAGQVNDVGRWKALYLPYFWSGRALIIELR